MSSFRVVAGVATLACAALELRAQTVLVSSHALPSGARVECEEFAVDVLNSPSLPAPTTTAPGVVWSWSDNGSGWIGTAVSLGLGGTQVFTETNKNAISANVLSSFDLDPPAAIWSDPAPQTDAREVVSAESADLHLAIHEIVLGIQRRAEVVARSSSSAVPLWSYTFAALITTGSDVGVARDGSRVVAAISRDEIDAVEIAVLDPEDGGELSYTSIPVNEPLHAFDLSADGATLLFTAGTEGYVFDVASATLEFSADVGTPLDVAAISGDGRVLAFGGYNWMRLWEQSGSTWTPTYTRYVPGSNYVSALDVSDDGSTLAFGFTYYDTFQTVRVEALDVAAKVLTMSHVDVGTGALQNFVSDVAISADGSRFAVGTWGGDAAAADELRYYARGLSTPLAAVDAPGSVFDVAISADGARVAAACKSVHANTLGNGGRVLLYDAGGEDFALHGAPRLGATATFELHGIPGRPAWLLVSEGISSPPFPAFGGALYLDRTSLAAVAMGRIAPSGVASTPYTFGSGPGLLGVTLYFQGLTLAPPSLTSGWLSVTVLP